MAPRKRSKRDSPEQDSPEQDSPEQDSPEQDSEEYKDYLRDNYDWFWVYCFVHVANIPHNMRQSEQLMDIIEPQAYNLFDCSDRIDEDAHIVVGTQRKRLNGGRQTDAYIGIGLTLNIHDWTVIINDDVVQNFNQFGTVTSADILEIRETSFEGDDEIVEWELKTIQTFEDFCERGQSKLS